jgi:hypothetical protein
VANVEKNGNFQIGISPRNGIFLHICRVGRGLNQKGEAVFGFAFR